MALLPHTKGLTPGITRRPASLPDNNRCRVGGRVHAHVRRRPTPVETRMRRNTSSATRAPRSIAPFVIPPPNAGANRRAINVEDNGPRGVRVRLSDLLGAAPTPAASARRMPPGLALLLKRHATREARTAQSSPPLNRASGARNQISSRRGVSRGWWARPNKGMNRTRNQVAFHLLS